MKVSEFYDSIDLELEEVINKHKNDEVLEKYKNDINNQKSYAFMIWFLGFYGQKSSYIEFITDGHGDMSCDIVFTNTDLLGREVYYIIQSKWRAKNNCENLLDSKEIKSSLNDFNTILQGKYQSKNLKLNTKLGDLKNHIEKNGEVKFILLCLCNNNPDAYDNLKLFEKTNEPKIKLEVIDIERIRKDYIERKYKKITPDNPMNSFFNPEETKVKLKIERSENNVNYVRMEKPFDSYIFLVRPKIIYELFELYSFKLFFKNVRNPLFESQINKQIEKSFIDEPNSFWYFNNGITAIAYKIPEIGKQATEMEVTGFQVINGAQTVYAIYNAYRQASDTKKELLDDKVFITVRLLQSGGKDFDLQVARYTNSQNQIYDRDFQANDDVQFRIQNESFSTNYWYEKRRDEFREVPFGVKIVSNKEFAAAYLAFYLRSPEEAIHNERQIRETGKDMLFISRKDHPDGLYEKIFNSDTLFEDMLGSYLLMSFIFKGAYLLKRELDPKGLIKDESINFIPIAYLLLALFSIVYAKYLKNVNPNFSEKLTKQAIKDLENDDNKPVIKILIYILLKIVNQMVFADKPMESFENLILLLTSSAQYQKLKYFFEEQKLDKDEISKMNILAALEELGKKFQEWSKISNSENLDENNSEFQKLFDEE